MTTVALLLSAGMMMSLSLLRPLIILCSFPLRLFLGGCAELRAELTPIRSWSCCAASSSRWEAEVSVATIISSVAVCLGVTVLLMSWQSVYQLRKIY